MSTLKTHNLQSPDAGSVNIFMTSNAGMIVTGISTFNNKVLLGTGTEGNINADDLTIATTGHTGITLRSGTSNYGQIFFSDAVSGTGEYEGIIAYDHSDNSMVFHTSTTEKVRIQSAGQLLIGTTTSSTSNLVVYGTGPNNKPATIYQNSLSGTGAANGFYVGSNHGETVGYVWNYENQPVILGTNNTERVRILSNGAVGINTDNFSSVLNNEVGLAIHGSSNDNCRISLTTPTKSNTLIGYYGLSNKFGVDVNNGLEIRDSAASYATRLRINTDGKINIGTHYNASTTYLDIRFDETTTYNNGSNHVNGLKIFNDCSTDGGFAGIELAATDGDDYYGSTLLKSVADGTNYSNDFVIQTRHSGNYQERLRINSDGNIGVGNFSGGSVPQTLSVYGNMYMRQGDYITWNNGDSKISGISGYHLQFSTYNGSSMTEAMQIKSDSSIYLPKGLTNRYGMYEVATAGTLNPSSATTWTWNFITQSGTGSVFKIEAYFNHWNTNSNYWSYQEHIVMHRDAHSNYAGFDIRRHAGGLGSWATEILTNTGNTYNEKIRVKWNVGSGSAYMGGYYIRISTPNAIDPESLVVA